LVSLASLYVRELVKVSFYHTLFVRELKVRQQVILQIATSAGLSPSTFLPIQTNMSLLVHLLKIHAIMSAIRPLWPQQAVAVTKIVLVEVAGVCLIVSSASVNTTVRESIVYFDNLRAPAANTPDG